MDSYSSIETVFRRNSQTNRLDFGTIREPETNLIKSWNITEKVDGTNIRVICTLDGLSIKGRTDKASIPAGLEEEIRAKIDLNRVKEIAKEFAGKELWEGWNLTIYGEGYGAGIQKGGGNYSPAKRFIAFDVLLSGRYWLSVREFDDFCTSAQIARVPDLGWISDIPQSFEELNTLIPYSRVSESDIKVDAEGIVAKPALTLFNGRGERVMWKLTKREWK